MVLGIAGCRPRPFLRFRHARDDERYYEGLRRGLLGYDTIYVHQEELLVLVLALPCP
jgi:hypothetical protein